jgi:hypothetical protein
MGKGKEECPGGMGMKENRKGGNGANLGKTEMDNCD